METNSAIFSTWEYSLWLDVLVVTKNLNLALFDLYSYVSRWEPMVVVRVQLFCREPLSITLLKLEVAIYYVTL